MSQPAHKPTSWIAEVIADSSGKWCSNALRFANKAECEAYAQDLAIRWTAVRDWRIVPSDDQPNRRPSLSVREIVSASAWSF